METRVCLPLEYSVQYQLDARKPNCTCDQHMNYSPQSELGVQKNTHTGKPRKATQYYSNNNYSNTGYRDLSRSHTCSSRSPAVFGNSKKLNVIVWIVASLFILMKRCNGFPQGSSIVANFEQTYCQTQAEALNRAPNHVDPRLCGGTCTPRPVTDGRYTIQVNTSEYSTHNVQVDIRAAGGANILGFAVVAVSERNVTAGRWVLQEGTNTPVVRATCDALLQGQVVFHARASRERSRVTVIWDSRRTNFGRIFFRAWVVQQHSQIFVLHSEPLTNRLNGSEFVSLESKFRDVISGISVHQSTPSTARQQSESAGVNSTRQVPSTASVTHNSAPPPTSTSVTQNSTPTSVTQNSTPPPTSTSVTQNSTPSSTPTSVTHQPESLSNSSTAPTPTLSNVTSSTNIADVTQVQPESHKTNHSPNSNRKTNPTFTNVDNARMPPLVSLKEFEDAFGSRMSNGYKINGEDPFGEFNRASYQLTDFIPQSTAGRLTNTSLDPFRTELVLETNGRSVARDIQPTNGESSLQASEQTAGQGQLQGRVAASFADQNLGSLADQLQGGPRRFPTSFSGRFPGQTPEQQQGQFPGQSSFQRQGQFPGLFPFQQQGQFPGQTPLQQQGQFPGQTPLQQQGQFPGQTPLQQQGQFPGQTPLQQQGQFPSQTPLQQQGQFPSQSPSQQQGQLPGLFPFQQQGQFPSQTPLQQQGQFPGLFPLQQQGQFPGLFPFQRQGQFPGLFPFQRQGQFPGQTPLQQQGQFPSQSPSQQQGQFSGQSQSQQQGQFSGLFPFQRQGQFLSQPAFQQQGQFPGQSPLQQQGQIPGHPPVQMQGQFPGQSTFQQQGQFSGQSPFQQQGQFSGQSTFQQQGQFPGQSPFQQQGQFSDQSTFQQQGQFPGQSPFQQQGQFSGQSTFQQQGQFPGQSLFQQQGQFPGQSLFQQQGQFPGQSPWLQFLNPAQRQTAGRVNGDLPGFSAIPWMPNMAANNLGSNLLNNFPNPAQLASAASGPPAWNTPSSLGNQGSAPFQTGALGENPQLQLNSALNGQGHSGHNPNGGTQTDQFGGFFNMFGGSSTSRWQRNNLNGFRGFTNAARMFG